MAERFANLAATLLNGAYTSGSGVLNVDSTAAPFPQSGNFRVSIADPTSFEVHVILKVTGINSSTQFAVTAEGSDVNASDNDLCVETLSKDGLWAMFGDALAAGTYGSLPAVTNLRDGSRYKCTDCQLEFVLQSGAWQAYFMGVPVTAPAATSFSWRNQGSATVTTIGGTVYLDTIAAAGEDWKCREITAPSTPYSITGCFIPNLFDVNNPTCGLYFADNGTGKLSGVRLVIFAGGPNQLQVAHMASPTSFAAQPALPQVWVNGPFWLKVLDDGTDHKFYFSQSGLPGTFVLIWSESRTAYLATPDRVGFHVNALNATYAAAIHLVDWTQGTS